MAWGLYPARHFWTALHRIDWGSRASFVRTLAWQKSQHSSIRKRSGTDRFCSSRFNCRSVDPRNPVKTQKESAHRHCRTYIAESKMRAPRNNFRGWFRIRVPADPLPLTTLVSMLSPGKFNASLNLTLRARKRISAKRREIFCQ